MEVIKMKKYIFKVDGKIVNHQEVEQLLANRTDRTDFLFDTEPHDERPNIDHLRPDARIWVKQVEDISQDTLILALYSTISYLLLDSEDGTIPQKYTALFKKLGDKLIDLDLNYEDCLDELIGLLGESL